MKRLKVNSVLARELYLDLGMASDQWSRWAKSNIEENKFFSLGTDFIELDIMSSSPNPPKDYAVTIEFAKHIAMMAKTQRAHDLRIMILKVSRDISTRHV